MNSALDGGEMGTIPEEEGQIYSGIAKAYEGAGDSSDYEELKAANKPEGRQFVQCTQYSPTPLNGKRITISCRDGALKSGGLFSSSYLHYKIYTEPVGYVVTRKDEEFYKIRKHLRKHYPYVIIPPLP